jgi:hypothetical protein
MEYAGVNHCGYTGYYELTLISILNKLLQVAGSKLQGKPALPETCNL